MMKAVRTNGYKLITGSEYETDWYLILPKINLGGKWTWKMK